MSIAKRLKRRMPTVIAVIVLLAVWETWVDLGHVSPTMISAPSEIFAATIETWKIGRASCRERVFRAV